MVAVAGKPAVSLRQQRPVSLRQRRWHQHSGVKHLQMALTSTKRVPGGLKRFTIGHWCPICGFEPNENARRLQQQAIEQILEHQRRYRRK